MSAVMHAPQVPALPGRTLLRAILALAALAALAVGAWQGYLGALELPIRNVRFAGDTGRVDPADLEQFARSLHGIPGGAATLGAVREAARKLPWVREVTVRRVFPDGIEVRLEEYQLLARWSETQLVSPQGEVFTAEYAGVLPRLKGPEGSAAEMARELPAILGALAPLGSPLTELRLSARGAWQAVLASGLVLELGRTDLVPRIERFAAAWPRIAETAPTYADLRYPNGFALRRNAARADKH